MNNFSSKKNTGNISAVNGLIYCVHTVHYKARTNHKPIFRQFTILSAI